MNHIVTLINIQLIHNIEQREWPMINMRAKEAEKAAQMFLKKK